MLRFKWIRILLLTGVLAVATATGQGEERQEVPRRSVLILHSYHKGDWTDSLLEGMNSVFQSEKNLDLTIEYMDTKRLAADVYLESLAANYRLKYVDITFDLILTSDDHALLFALKHQYDLFKGSPIVFCGVNRYDPELLDGHPDVTGVIEKGDFVETLAFAFKVRPEAKRVLVVCDSTHTGQLNKAAFQDAFEKQGPGGIKAEYLTDVSRDQLAARLQTADPDDFVFFISFWEDSRGDPITPDKLGDVFRNSAAPVFGRSEWMLGRGQVGGKCVSGFRQGRTAAELGEQILAGKSAAEIPVNMNSPNQFMFDYQELTKHNIKLSALPPDHELLNRPLSFYRVPKRMLALFVICAFLLIAFVLVLIVNNRIRYRAARALAASEQRYRALVDNIDLGITLVDTTHRVVMTNAAQQKMFNKPEEAFCGEKCYKVFENRDEICEHCPGVRAMETKQPQYEESKGVRQDGSQFPVAIRAFPLRDADDEICGFVEVVEDITARRQAVTQRDMLFRLSIDLLSIAGFDGRFKQLNPAWEETLGWSLGELQQRPLVEFIHPQDRKQTQEAFQRLRTGEAISNFQNRFQHHDGSWRWLSWNVFPMIDEQVIFAVARDVTTERQAERALRESEERFRNIVESSPMGIHVYELRDDEQLVLVGANPTADRLTGIRTRERFGKTIEEAFPNLADSEVPERYKRIARLGTSWRTEDLIYDDDEIDGAYDLVAFQTSANRMAVMFMDITERKRAQARLRFTQFAVDHSAEAAFWMRADGRFTYVNEAASRSLGYSTRELLELRFQDINPDFPEDLWAARWEDLKASGSFTMESRHQTRDGRLFPVEITFNFVEFEGREYNCAFARDISERREAEEQVLKFKTITDNANYGAIIADMDYRLIYVNQAFADLHHCDPDDLIGRHIASCHAEEERDYIEELLHQTETEGGFVGKEVWHQRPDASRFLTLMSMTLVRNERGRHLYLAATAIDITGRREIEEQLRQAQKMESIGQLAGGVAHDFNNMLGGIIGFAELLRNDLSDNVEHQEFVHQIINSAERASDLTRKLLAFSRKGRVLSTPVDVHSVAQAAVSILERSIDRRIQINTRLDAEEHMVCGDSAQLQNAILNLCINARDAMPNGGTLTLQSANEQIGEDDISASAFPIQPGAYLVLSVADTGIGMTPKTVEHIFEPFFTTKGIGKGTGLGLAAVYGTANEHHGSIDVESIPGEGSVFRLLLPLITSETPDVESEPGMSEEDFHGSGTILLVDDEPVVRAMGEALLKQLGYEVLLAYDGQEGLERFQEHHDEIDLVILDILMPRMNGQDCFHAIREIDPNAKVLISSGFAHDASIAQLESEGLCGFVMKPYHREAMGKAVKEALSQEEGDG